MRVRPFFWILLLGVGAGVLTLAAVMPTETPQIELTPRSRPAVPIVLMGPTNFVQRSITLEQGQRLTLIQDASDEHIITNGSRVGSNEQPMKKLGAPTVNVTVSGVGSRAIVGPFNTVGTFHLYCTIHQGMNLAVKVQ